MDKQNKEIKKYKDIQVDYLRFFKEIINSKGDVVSNQPHDITKVLEKCVDTPVKERTMQYKGEIIRLQEVKKIEATFDNLKECKNLWKLNFVRIKTDSMSAIASEDGGFDETLLNTKLLANQYLADSTACLYDGDKQLFIIARNRDGVLPSGILEFVRKISKLKELVFAIIPVEAAVNSKESNIYRNIIIGVNNVHEMNKKDKKFLHDKIPSVFNAIKSFEGYGYYNIRIELSMGTAPRKYSMNNEVIMDASLQLMESSIKNISKLEVSSKESEKSSIETIDLLNNKIKDVFRVSYSRKEPVLYAHIIASLLGCYDKKIVTIKNKIS